MARDAELKARVTLDDKASKGLDEIADKADDLESQPVELTVQAKVDKATGALDEVASDARKAALAAEALGQALGPELSAKADMSKVIRGFEQAGLSLDEITQNADQLGAKLRDVAGPDGSGLDQISGRARAASEDTDKLSDSARGANSALANMVGNAAQDLGGLSGVAGSAGVAIGQMAEYMSDAALGGERLSTSIGSMLKIAGPIAAIAAVTQVFGNVMADNEAKTEASAAATDMWSTAMSSGGDAAANFATELKKTDQVMADVSKTNDAVIQQTRKMDQGWSGLEGAWHALFGGGDTSGIEDIAKLLGQANLTIDQYTHSLSGGAAGLAQWTAAVRASNISTDDQEKLISAVTTGQESYNAALAASGRNASIFATSQAQANAMLRDAANQADPLSRMVDVWATLWSDMADGVINTDAAASAIDQLAEGLGISTDEVIKLSQQHLDENLKATADAADQAAKSAQEFGKVLSSSEWDTSGIDAAVTAYQRFGETQFGLANIAANTQAAYDGLGKAIEENGFTFDTATEAGRANAEQIQSLYSSLIPQLSAAYADAGGSVDKFGQNLDTLRSGVFQQLDEQTSLSADQINAVIDQLGVFDGSTYSSQFELLGLEDATTKLGLLSGVIGSLPDDVQKQVTLSILAGDPQAALDAIQASVEPGATTPLHADPTSAEATAAGFISDTEGSEATVPVIANVKPAEDQRAGFVKTTEGTKPVVQVDANTQAAIATMVLLKVLAQLLAPTVQVNADTSQASQALQRLAGTTTRVPVEAYLSDYPSASEIAARIGRPRIPVDIVVGQSIRITGVRE